MEGSYMAHNLQKNSRRTNNKDKQITSVNPEKHEKKKMSFKLLFELRKRMYVTEAVWKRIPNSRSSKMKGACTGRLKINTGRFQ